MDSIEDILSTTSQQGMLEGISIVNFLQMIEMEGKTYLFEVINPLGMKGLVYFKEGILHDALCGDLVGEPAALEMFTWDNVQISFRNLPAKKIRRRIEKKLMSLLMEAMALKDETDEALSTMDFELDEPNSTQPEEPVRKDNVINLWESEAEAETIENELPVQEDMAGVQSTDEAAIVRQRIFREIMGVRGVRAVGMIGREGQMIETAGTWLGVDFQQLGVSIAMLHRGAENMGRGIELESFNTLTLESVDATIMCSPVKESLLIVVSPNSDTLGIIRQKVRTLLPGLMGK